MLPDVHVDPALLFDAVPALLFVVAPDSPTFTIQAATDACLRATGRSRAEVVGRPLLEVFSGNPRDPAAPSNLQASLDRVLATRREDTMPLQRDVWAAAGGGGHDRRWRAVSVPVLGPDGDVACIIHRIDEVTDIVRAPAGGALHRVPAAAAAAAAAGSPLDAIPARDPAALRPFAREAELEQSLAVLDALVMEAPLGIAFVDRDFRFVRCSNRIAEMNGTPASAHLGRTVAEIVPHLWPILQPIYERALAGQPVANIEFAGETAAQPGVVRHWRASYYPVRRNEQVIGLGIVVDETTDQVRASVTLRTNAALFTEIIEQAPGGVYVVDADFRLRHANGEAMAVFASVHPLLGRDFDEIMHILWGPVVGAQCAAVFRHTLATGERYVSPPFMEQRDDLGVAQAYDWETQRITMPDGRFGVVCHFRDVTERRRAEQALRASEASERERRRELEALMDAIPAAVFMSRDAACTDITANQAAKDLFGAPSLAHFNPTAPERERVPLEVWSEGRRLATDEMPMQRVASTGRALTALDLELITGDNVRSLFGSVLPLFDDAGRPRGCVGAFVDQTARRLAERAVRESEQRVRLAAAASGAGIWEWNVKTDRILWDAQMFRLYGVPPTADGMVDYAVWRNAVLADDLPAQEAALQQVVRRAGEGRRTFRIRRADTADVRWLEAVEAVRLDAHGEVEWVVGTNLDVTAMREAQAQVQARQRELQALADNCPDILTRFDRKLRHVFINLAIRRATGRSPVEFLGKTNHEVGMPIELCTRWDAALRRVFERAQPQSLEFEYDAPTGRRYYGARLVPEFDGSGQVEFVLGITSDITDVKQAQREIAELNRRLEHRVRELQTILEVSPVGISIAEDPQCRQIWINPVLRDLLRLPAGANASKSAPADERPAFRAMRNGVELTADQMPMQRCIALGRPVIGEELDVVLPDGTTFCLSKSAVPLFDEQGRARGCIAFNIDLTERKRAEEELRKADRRKDEFLATLAHELRNPLAPLRNAAQILKVNSPTAEQVAFARNVISRQVEQMIHLIDDLMDLGRISQGRVELKREWVDLARVVEGAVETSRPHIEGKRQTFNVVLPPEPVLVDADPTRLSQVVLNLLNNAAKYTAEGGRVELRAERQGGDVVLTVTDSGIGIPQDQLSSIFDMFSQLESTLAHSQGGLGIGLFLVRRLVELHGGSVRARSDGNGRGSEFVVRLPIVVRDAFAAADVNRDDPMLRSDLRILVVDDNRDAASSLALLLQMMGNTVHTAHDGEEAVESALRLRPDVVLLDIGLPKKNGYEAARAIREQQGGGRTTLIAVTGWGDDESRQRTAVAGFDRHLVKPVDPQGLASMLAELQRART